MLELLAVQIIGTDYPPDHPPTNPGAAAWNTKFRADVGSAWQAGAQRSKQEGCDFFKQNPDIVYAIRNAAQVSNSTGLPYWFPSLQDANNRGSPRGPTLID
jgi:hypothetical protein